MAVPSLNVLDFYHNGAVNMPMIVWRISQALSKPPYFIKLTGLSGAEATDDFSQIIDFMGGKSAQAMAVRFKKTSHTDVFINRGQAEKQRAVTAYSRTNLPLNPHTDSSYLPVPHEFVGFLCVAPAKAGGHNTVVVADDIIARLRPETVRILQESSYPFGRGDHAVVSRAAPYEIRYYRGQIDHALMRGASLGAGYLRALDELDAVLEQAAHETQFMLAAGEALLLNNRRALHGRLGFEEGSSRHYIRLRQFMNFDRLVAMRPAWGYRIAAAFRKKKSWPSDLAQHRLPVLESKPADRRPNVSGMLETYDYLLEGTANVEDIIEAARNTLRAGRFLEARQLFEKALEQDDQNISVKFSLSAIYHYLGDEAGSELLRQNIAQQSPFNRKFTDTDTPKILRVRGLKDIKYTLLKGKKGYKETLQRGHFSLKDLCSFREYQTVMLSIFDEQEDHGLSPDLLPDLILNTMSCGDRMRGALTALDRLVNKYPDIPVINQPSLVIATNRAENAIRLNAIEGVICPKTLLFTWHGGSAAKMAQDVLSQGFEFPIILRPMGAHTGSGVMLAQSAHEAELFFNAAPIEEEYYAIQYRDLSDKRGLFSKTRLFYIGGTCFPVASLMHNSWNVHSGDRYSVMDKNLFMREKEESFLADMPAVLGDKAMTALSEIYDTVKLDFFGVDLMQLTDGTLFIFECNAAMRHNYDHVKSFPYTRPHLQNISKAFETMVQQRVGILDV